MALRRDDATGKIDTLRTFGQSDTLLQNKGGESMSNSREKQAMPTEVPFSLVGIDHVVLLVDDMRTALGFYYGVLGCQRGYSYPDLGMEQVWCGSSLIVLWDVTHPGGRKAAPPVSGGRNVDHICIATGPFDHEAMRAHLESNGVEIHQEAFHGGREEWAIPSISMILSAISSRSRDRRNILTAERPPRPGEASRACFFAHHPTV